jgi:tRNA(Arg) A34 adenosine deaminase TadA
VSFPSVYVALPAWVDEVCEPGQLFPTLEERVDLVLKLARSNFEHETGGPFGSAVFDHNGSLVSAGVNMVVPSSNAFAHAEIVAIGLAGKAVGNFNLTDHAAEIVASTEPCAMCLGAVPWSGIRRLVCSARDEDASRIGFEEGDKPADWSGKLQKRGIEVVLDVKRNEGAAVLTDYVRAGGVIYNGVAP